MNSPVALVRAAPGTGESNRFLRWLESRHQQPGAGLVFFQGDAVHHALVSLKPDALPSRWRYLVCSGSWQRRCDHAPVEPFEIGSLMTFFDTLCERPGEFACFGQGGGH